MEIGTKIKQRRLELGLTMKQVAEAVGVSEALVSMWESGNVENMKRDKIAKLATTLKVRPTFIIFEEENAPTEPVETLSKSKRELIELVRNLDESQVAAILALLRK